MFPELEGWLGLIRGTISTSYSSVSLSGDDFVGGLVGQDQLGQGVVFRSFWDTQVSGCSTSVGGLGLSTAEMKQAATFSDWNGCGGIWTLDEGNDYPHLVWEGKPGTVFLPSQLNEFLEGSGTESDPYLIFTAEDLNLIGRFPCEWDKHYRLMEEIDLSSYTHTDFHLIGISDDIPFTGQFDGNGHTISHLTYLSEERFVGLFRALDNSARFGIWG